MTIPTEATKKPLVSIVVPVFNDEEYIGRALDTALNQSLKNIEIICVDDQSTDGTVHIIEKYVKKDNRVKLIQQKENSSAFQARYTGIKAAQAEYILFLDGDDELHRDTAKLSHIQAVKSKSDIVGFGSKILRKDGSISRDYESLVQPTHKKLLGSNIVARLFEPNKPAQGQMWRYLFTKELLLKAYSYFPENQKLYRINDLPVVFMSASLAKKYTSIKNRLYIYHFYAGRSGGADFDLDKFKFYTQGIDSINLLRTALESGDFSKATKDSYFNARLSVIYNVLQQIKNSLPAKYHDDAIKFLLTKIALDELVFSMANFIPEALDAIRSHLPLKTAENTSKNIGLFTNNLHTGGIQAVVMSQAKYLRDAGFNVTILLLRDDDISFEIPDRVNVELVAYGPVYARLVSFKSILEHRKIDTIINHNVLYNFVWPFYNLIAKDLNIKVHAWLHSFPLRPMTEGSANGKFLNDNLNLIDDLIVLSKADVSYYKSLGHKNVYYMPNPPSPLLIENNGKTQPKSAPTKHLNVVWVGRLQQATKGVFSLIDIAMELKKITSNFTLTLIGPDSNDLKAVQVRDRLKSKQLESNVKVVGPKHGKELIDELKKADLYLNTSVIEGYLLTLVEAQTYGLPVVMYELPWLTTVENNNGVIQTPQKNPAIAAQEIYRLFTDHKLYEAMSKEALKASASYLSYDFVELYTQLLHHRLPKQFSPEINIEHMGLFTKWTQFYFVEAMGAESADGLDILKRKNAEIEALKNSKAMKIGNAVANPIRAARTIKHKVAKRLKNR